MVPEIYKNELLAIVARYIPRCAICLFGSRATGQHAPSSDIDIALDAGMPIAPRVLGDIKDSIMSSNIPYFVDVVDIHAVSGAMRGEIEKTGVLWKSLL